MKSFSIYYHDLVPSAQMELCEEFDTTAEEENWDSFPLTVIERREEEKEEKEEKENTSNYEDYNLLRERKKTMADELNETCGNCGLSLGSHHGGSTPWPYNYCPGHEGRMDWPEGPGTIFSPTGTFKEIVYNTPAKN